MEARLESVENAARLLEYLGTVGARFYFGEGRDSRRSQELVGSVQRIEVIDDGLDVEFTLISMPAYEPTRLRLSSCDIAPLNEQGHIQWDAGFRIPTSFDVAEHTTDMDQGLSDLLGP